MPAEGIPSVLDAVGMTEMQGTSSGRTFDAERGTSVIGGGRGSSCMVEDDDVVALDDDDAVGCAGAAASAVGDDESDREKPSLDLNVNVMDVRILRVW